MNDYEYLEIDDIRMKSGSKQVDFGTGSVRDAQDDKIRYDFISPIFTKMLAIWCTLGAKKYIPRNWEKGQPLHQYVSSMCRHLQGFMMGQTDESHLVAVAWNIMAYLHTEQMCLKGELPEQLLTYGSNQRFTEIEYEEWVSNKRVKI